MNSNDMEMNPQSEMMDPLIWHYQRERRLAMSGTVAWDHEISNMQLNLKFFIKVNFNFISNSTYLDVLVPSTVPSNEISGILAFIADNAKLYASKGPVNIKIPVIKERAAMIFDNFPDQEMISDNCMFTGRIFFYTSYEISPEDKLKVVQAFKNSNLFIIIRDAAWINNIKKYIDRPTVFLSHDSKDKDYLARELANTIDGKEIKVWYDELSLKPGDRLRKSLDKGLEESDYFMPLITENFIKNTRYAEYELDAIMQKYVTEKTPIIVPICVDINPNRLNEISRVLADFVAIQHETGDGISALVRKITMAVDPKIPTVGDPLPPDKPQGKKGLFSVGVSFWQENPPDSD